MKKKHFLNFSRQDPPRIDRMPTRIKPKFKIHDEFKTDWLKFDIGKEEIFVIIYFLLHQKMIFILISFDEFFVSLDLLLYVIQCVITSINFLFCFLNFRSETNHSHIQNYHNNFNNYNQTKHYQI